MVISVQLFKICFICDTQRACSMIFFVLKPSTGLKIAENGYLPRSLNTMIYSYTYVVCKRQNFPWFQAKNPFYESKLWFLDIIRESLSYELICKKYKKFPCREHSFPGGWNNFQFFFKFPWPWFWGKKVPMKKSPRRTILGLFQVKLFFLFQLFHK